MAHYKLRVTLPYQSGLSSDVAVNDFSVDATLGTLSVILVDLALFYIGTPTGQPASLSTFFSTTLSRVANACHIDAYDRAGAPGAGPVDSVTFTLDAASVNDNLPEEAAIACSFHGDLTAPGMVNKARHRGRVFLGPFNVDAKTQDVNERVLVSQPVRDCILAASEDLYDQIIVEGGNWEVWSTVDASGDDVVGGWVDNAWDTIRSRGPEPTNHFLWP